MSFNYGHNNQDERRIDLSDPWYKNAGLVAAIQFFAILAVGLIILALL